MLKFGHYFDGRLAVVFFYVATFLSNPWRPRITRFSHNDVWYLRAEGFVLYRILRRFKNQQGCLRFFSIFFLLLFGDSRGILIRNLALHTNKVGNITSSITKGGNEELIPEGSTIHAVVEQANRHVMSLFDSLTDTFDGLGIGLGPLEETAITSQDLVQGVPSQVQETLTGVDNRIVRQTRIGHDKVLLGRLKRLDEGKVGVVEDLVGNGLTVGQQTVNRRILARVEQFGGTFLSQVSANGVAQLFVFFLEQGHRLLQGFQKELFANARTLSVFTVTLTVDKDRKQSSSVRRP